MQNNEQRYALVKNSLVENIIIADNDFVGHIRNEWDEIVELSEDNFAVSIGWTYADNQFTKPVVITPEPEVEVVPDITQRQLRLALLSKGMLSGIPEKIATLESPNKQLVEIEWQYGTTFTFESQFTELFTKLLNLTNAEMKDLFLAAATL